ncbi:hypothetical protein SD70_19245 [Gordoniibacillus kamchatkensis]|uniref:Leucine-rich repeat domain-containing protein n=1 Tax=Gordoniibacillus kamchatkensis TaxID=1590651 RepID=A0ABR5AER6_9BACL|nr:leucine-rich repeat domain-containing protein [Paenibacillus sp. VKM B-2647]KIL39541.1 hypothetical protein SD70_19245 [Paenibacillus sp. VKM B-2647]
MGFIDFMDKGFESAVKTALGMGKERLSHKDVARLDSILIFASADKYLQVPWQSESGAFNIHKPGLCFNVLSSENGLWQSDLRHFNRLKALYLYAETTDLSFLSNFSKLTELHVVDSRHKDWSFLGELLNLRCLFVQNASLQDLRVLGELAIKQEEIAARSSDPFLWSHKLEFVRLIHCGIQDMSPLAELKWLAELDLSHNEISDFSSVLDLPLYSLTFRYNRLSDLSLIARDRWHLDYLDVRHNQITDISPLVHFVNLSKLCVGHNPITDYSVLNQLPVQRHDVDSYNPRRKRG